MRGRIAQSGRKVFRVHRESPLLPIPRYSRLPVQSPVRERRKAVGLARPEEVAARGRATIGTRVLLPRHWRPRWLATFRFLQDSTGTCSSAPLLKFSITRSIIHSIGAAGSTGEQAP